MNFHALSMYIFRKCTNILLVNVAADSKKIKTIPDNHVNRAGVGTESRKNKGLEPGEDTFF